MSHPDIQSCTLQDGDVSVTLLNLGCITQNWRVPLGTGRVSVVLGYNDPAAYLNNPAYLGTIVGRVANRIAGAQYHHDGATHSLAANEGRNMLHGGPGGISTRVWNMEPDGGRSVRFSLRSPHGDQGFPGDVDFQITVSLRANTLTYDMRASVDRPTPINLAQHSYYNLLGGGTVRTHRLCLQATKTTPVDDTQIPFGTEIPVAHSRFDFRTPTRLDKADPAALGYDTNFVLNRQNPAAVLHAPNGLALSIHTDQPGLQVYTANALQPLHQPLPGQDHLPYSGICLEPQGFPNALNTPAFPDIMVHPDMPYAQKLNVTISEGTAP